MYSLIKPLVFCCDPEAAHEMTLKSVKLFYTCPGLGSLNKKLFYLEDSCLTQELWGQSFINPLGVAAGFDKNAVLYNPLFDLGFGFVEVGTVTPKPQPGNPKPRIFRLPEDQAVINRLGFNNHGVTSLLDRISAKPPQRILGINIGKNKDTSLKKAFEDYKVCLQAAFPKASYLVVNISSPNTKGLRSLQEGEALSVLLRELMVLKYALEQEYQCQRPLLVKIAPDLSDSELESVVDALCEFSVDGVIATNTTIERPQLHHQKYVTESGGLSGKPLQSRSTEMIRRIYRQTHGKLPIIGVGGIFNGQDAYEKIKAGASLLQVYTGMIYHGPSIARNIKKELLYLLQQEGFNHITDAVGSENHQ